VLIGLLTVNFNPNEELIQKPTKVQVEDKKLYAADMDADKEGMITKTFVITNYSNEEVKILDVNPHCSCTGYTLVKDLLKPKEKTELKLSVSLSQLKNLKKTYAVIKTDGNPKLLVTTIMFSEK
jgi:sialic acid synthase SpsE